MFKIIERNIAGGILDIVPNGSYDEKKCCHLSLNLIVGALIASFIFVRIPLIYTSTWLSSHVYLLSDKPAQEDSPVFFLLLSLLLHCDICCLPLGCKEILYGTVYKTTRNVLFIRHKLSHILFVMVSHNPHLRKLNKCELMKIKYKFRFINNQLFPFGICF